MRKYFEFGQKIKAYRETKGESITKVAVAINKDRTYISKLENGHERPSELVLNRLISHFSLSTAEAAELSVLSGYKGSSVVVDKKERKEVTEMADINAPTGEKLPENAKQIQVDAGRTPILYTDSVFVTSSQWGIVFDFAQNVGPTNQQTVVARLGMSKEHAKALLDVLRKRLEADENQGKN